MLKCYDRRTGQLKYLILDDQAIRPVSSFSMEELQKLGIKLEEIEQTEERVLSGISQDDLKFVKGSK